MEEEEEGEKELGILLADVEGAEDVAGAGVVGDVGDVEAGVGEAAEVVADENWNLALRLYIVTYTVISAGGRKWQLRVYNDWSQMSNIFCIDRRRAITSTRHLNRWHCSNQVEIILFNHSHRC